MKIESLYLKNFRSYKEYKIDFDTNLNVIIGQNDIGKSTILEAFDIFFGQNTIKIDDTDYNVHAKDDGEIIIGITFKIDENTELIIDSKNKTNLKDEFLLNSDGKLEIIKKFPVRNRKVLKEKVFIRANYPSKIDLPLINLKISELKQKLEKLKIDEKKVNKTKSAEIRKSIYNHLNPKDFHEIEIDLQKEEGKNIWISLQKELPLFFLFQNDRENKDNESEIQNPLKSATKIVISELESNFEEIVKKVKKELEKIGVETINKMKEMGLDIARELKPVIKVKNWDSVFQFTLESDGGIPLNKRGSGFRRIVLLNYFRAEAEKNLIENKHIIYAFEEPETAQHPNNQKKLIDAFMKLSKKPNYQIFLTTHTPEIAKMVELNNLLFIENKDEQPNVLKGNDTTYRKIANALGIMPYYKNKIVVCVEGSTDKLFLENINDAIPEYKKIVDLNNIDIIPLKGSNLKEWVKNYYLKDSNVIEIHIYDSDIGAGKNEKQYNDECNKINARTNGSYCFLTEKREIENYIHWTLIEKEFKITFSDSEIKNFDQIDIPKLIFNKSPKKMKERDIKEILNGNLVKNMTKELLEELNAFKEIKKWFEAIKERM